VPRGFRQHLAAVAQRAQEIQVLGGIRNVLVVGQPQHGVAQDVVRRPGKLRGDALRQRRQPRPEAGDVRRRSSIRLGRERRG
jgi:hypothetical protein